MDTHLLVELLGALFVVAGGREWLRRRAARASDYVMLAENAFALVVLAMRAGDIRGAEMVERWRTDFATLCELAGLPRPSLKLQNQLAARYIPRQLEAIATEARAVVATLKKGNAP